MLGISLAAVVGVLGCGRTLPTAPTDTLPPPVAIGPACGTERWAVKTLSDPGAIRIDPSRPTATSIGALVERPGHCDGGPDERVHPEERIVFEVVARVSLARLEDDHDYHVVLEDPDAPGARLVSEVADPNCAGAAQSAFRDMLSVARGSFEALARQAPLAGRLVRVRGVGFYDFNHAQTGRAPNCLELHPVLSIEAVSSLR